ncbi:MAG TPA: sigma-70 family RNA polymerase sigma factor [Gemmatimonadales bacterium]|nr:sigma-70 family RNA polymerase sigma factor [Gemmatimonadales bacterium]
MDDQRRALPRPPGHSTSGQVRVHDDQDSALLRRMADGDEAALGTLYDRWAERVHALAFWILKDADEAEDVVEETFWQVWRTARRYDGKRSAGFTWLMIIARSRALDRLRSRRRRADWTASPATASALREQAGVRPVDLPGSQLDKTDRRSELASALGALPLEQRTALEMAYFQGLSHGEIAAQTSQPLGTVKTRIRLAMQKLRERLALLREED